MTRTLPRAPWLRRTLAYLIIFCLLISAAPQRVTAAVTAEICNSNSFFGTRGCGVSESAKIFWVPPCPTIPFADPLAGQSRFPRPAPSDFIVSILYNRYPARKLQLDGSRYKEIIIGSPNGSDIINGGPDGDNAYVVGGGTAIASADGSEVFPGGSMETDVVNLSSSAIDFVNIKPSGQGAPGTVLVPKRDTRGNLVRVGGLLQGDPRSARGSDELLSSRATSAMTTSCPVPSSMSAASRPVAITSLVGNRSMPLGMMGSIQSFPGKTLSPSPTEKSITPSFPGVPVIKGFDVNKGSDALVLSLDDFPVNTKAYPSILKREQPPSPQLTSGQAHRESPLTYYDKTGLLVLSLNRDPLGSQSNPGLVVAQLLDQSGLPLKLRRPSGSQLFPSRFVIFTPSEKKRADRMPMPPSKDPLSQ